MSTVTRYQNGLEVREIAGRDRATTVSASSGDTSGLFSQFSNGDGTYNGVKMLAHISGLSEAEVAWTAARLKQLMVVEKMPRVEAKRIVANESRTRPWEAP